MDLTHVTASLQWVVSDTQGQDTQTHIIAGETERVFFPRKLSQHLSEQSQRLLSLNKSIYSNEGTTGHRASV